MKTQLIKDRNTVKSAVSLESDSLGTEDGTAEDLGTQSSGGAELFTHQFSVKSQTGTHGAKVSRTKCTHQDGLYN